MMFEVGVRVVCLAESWDNLWGEVCPTRGREYVIRSIFAMKGIPFLRFHWLINPTLNYAGGRCECAFAGFNDNGSPNFRPVIERKTSIEVFTRILRDATKEIEEV